VDRSAKIEFREKSGVAEGAKTDATVGRRCREMPIRWMNLDVSDHFGAVAEKLNKARVCAETPDFDLRII
jgi:hypothetical protein